MLIAGIKKFSLIDFPSKLAAIVFTQGCQYRCHYCHNPSLISKNTTSPFSASEFFDFLKSRINKLDAVVITGGEPTLQEDLIDFIKEIKKLNFKVKLDTNGTNPQILKDLLDQDLLDYIAMDVKSTFENYEKIINSKTDILDIKKSINLILNSKVDYEFRTTIVQGLHTIEDVIEISKSIKDAKLFVLQKFLNKITLNPKYKDSETFSDLELENIKKSCLNFVKAIQIR